MCVLLLIHVCASFNYKLYIPLPRDNAVVRSDQIERLNEGLRRKSTLISAPTGFGKTGQYCEAKEYLQKSLETFGKYFKCWDIAQTLIILGRTQILSGDSALARKTLLDALRLSKEVHSRPLMLEALQDLASLEMRLDPERTAGWLMLVSTHPLATQETKDRACQQLQVLEEQLSIQQMQTIRENSLHPTLETIVDILV